jgi:hypothetical protein
MIKAPEEGRIWEWRAFGRISDELAARARAYPVRQGVINLRGEDAYLISAISDQNVKLRLHSTQPYLKFKLLLENKPGAFELYRESILYTYPFPVSLGILEEAAHLLKVILPTEASTADSFSEAEAVSALAASSPPVARVDVKKVRSQYQFDGGWVELAEVEFSHLRVQTVSIHSEDMGVIERMIDRLRPGDELEAMNYIEACRRWG